MSRRKSGWTDFAITCSPCIATTLLRSYTRLSRSYFLTWETRRWCMAGSVATSTSGSPCWMSRPDTPALVFKTMGSCSVQGSAACCFPLPLALTQLPCWALGLHSSSHPSQPHHLTAP
ncbi:PREDICTED: uncharacterized protein C6orf1 homolog isoform X1 [Miniopterus natalensis]|uniref:uncharacterized protein C6orf1 homolog isoform X1 n=1 Tax=Miniopterus natalensis TaxID=291302 RepID=UPI0007A72F46|nr:PREDICTED: uncharacterized protein C6orf1 homolog isoform X1 [Miniopterus natalensis]